MSERHGQIPRRLKRNPVKARMHDDDRYNLRCIPDKREKRVRKLRTIDVLILGDDDGE